MAAFQAEIESSARSLRLACHVEYDRSYFPAVKAAISIPDDLFREIDARARVLKLSRSALLARAAREFLESHRPAVDPTEAWNRGIERGGQPGDEPGPVAARRRTKAVVRGKGKRR